MGAWSHPAEAGSSLISPQRQNPATGGDELSAWGTEESGDLTEVNAGAEECGGGDERTEG